VARTIYRPAQGLLKQAARGFFIGIAALALAGCETSSIFNQASTTETQAPVVAPQRPKLAFVPLIGAPATVSNQLTASVVTAIEKQSIPVAKAPNEPADYTVRGYVVAAPEKTGTKLSYIWDVNDKGGTRVHRITGEEFVAGKAGKDPWSIVDQPTLDRIATNTSAQLGAWVPAPQAAAPLIAGQAPTGTATQLAQGAPIVPPQPAVGGQVAAQPVASSGLILQPQNANVGGAAQPQQNLVDGKVVAPKETPIVASLPAGTKATTMVPAVIGAPGDGAVSLTKAISRQLVANGFQPASSPGPTAYTVQGKVSMGQPADGKQTIKIEWQVFDPAGKRVGTVSQSNAVPQGSLDGAWGKTADAAAAAASQGIVKLLPKPAAVN
jgi:hypothetical protein